MSTNPASVGQAIVSVADRPIADVVRDVLVDVLSVEPEVIVPSAEFFADLDGESIDVLEMEFQFKKLYGVTFEIGRHFAGSVQTDTAGVVLPESLAALREQFPFLAIDRLPPSPTTETLKQLMTVDAITHMVERQLSAATNGAID